MKYKTLHPTLLTREIYVKKIIENEPDPEDILKLEIAYLPENQDEYQNINGIMMRKTNEITKDDIIYVQRKNTTPIYLDEDEKKTKYLLVSEYDILVCQNKS